MRFRGLDLNLLVSLEALLTRQNVTRAAESLFIGQSAMSGALARLRTHFGDPLIVRVGHSMRLTPLAECLVDPVREILLRADALTALRPSFDPSQANREVVVTASDYAQSVLLLPLVSRLAREAPGVSMRVIEYGPAGVEAFGRSESHLMTTPSFLLTAAASETALLTDDYVCIAAVDNDEVGEKLTLDQYQTLPHVARYEATSRMINWENRTLARYGVTRNIQLVLPHVSLIPAAVAITPYIATVQRRLAALHAPNLPIKLVDPPFRFEPLDLRLQWWPHHDADPAFKWLRGIILEEAQALLHPPATHAPHCELRTVAGHVVPTIRSGPAPQQARGLVS